MGNSIWKWCPQNVGYFVSGSQCFNPEGQVSVPYWFLTWWERPPGCMGRLAWPEGCVNSLRPEKIVNIFIIFLNQIFHILIEMLLKFVVKVTIQVKACCWTGDNVSPGPAVKMVHMILYDDTRPQWVNIGQWRPVSLNHKKAMLNYFVKTKVCICILYDYSLLK